MAATINWFPQLVIVSFWVVRPDWLWRPLCLEWLAAGANLESNGPSSRSMLRSRVV